MYVTWISNRKEPISAPLASRAAGFAPAYTFAPIYPAHRVCAYIARLRPDFTGWTNVQFTVSPEPPTGC